MGGAIGRWYCPYFRIKRSDDINLLSGALERDQYEGNFLPHTRYKGIVDTLVQLFYSPASGLIAIVGSETLIGPRKIFLVKENDTVPKRMTKSVAQQQQKIEIRSIVGRISGFTIIAAALAVLAVIGAAALFAQGQNKDKYSLISPGGIAFSDFRGYEDWSAVSTARTDEVLKVIVANPTMIKAYKDGIPGNGQAFPEGSLIVKLQWKPKKSTEAQFAVDVPDVFSQAFVMEKDSKRFPKTGGWGYAVFNYDAASDKFTADAKSLSDCGNACHTVVKAKDYIFHPYQKR